ncbi:hypothetical protein, partial [Enterobacter asburiae]
GDGGSRSHSALDVFKTWLLNELNLGKIR